MGRQAGYISEKRKFACKTKVVRIPETLDFDQLIGCLEAVKSRLDDFGAEMDESRSRSAKGVISNRYEKGAELAEELQDLMTSAGLSEYFEK